MKKETVLNIGRVVGILIVIAGVFAKEYLPADKNYIASILIIVGVIINVISFSSMKMVYVCPECRAQFDMPKGEITLTTGKRSSLFRASLLTCPKCKKTNLCMGRRVARK